MIGRILLGCGVLVGAVAWIDLPREEDSRRVWWERETVRIDLAARVEIGKIRLARAEAALSEQWTAEEKLSELRKRVTELEARRSALQTEVAKQSEEISKERESTLLALKRNARGLEFARLESVGGRVFEQVRVTEVTDAGVEIRHEHGSSRLTYHELTAEQRGRFGLEEKKSAAALVKEAELAREYERGLLQGGDAADRGTPAARRAPATAERFAAPAPRPAIVRQSALSQPAWSVGRSSSRPRNYRRTDVYYYQVYNPYPSCAPMVYRPRTITPVRAADNGPRAGGATSPAPPSSSCPPRTVPVAPRTAVPALP